MGKSETFFKLKICKTFNNTEILKTSIEIKNSDVIKYFLIETQFNKSIFKWSLLEFQVLTIDKSQPAEYQIYCYDFSESAFKFQFKFEHFRYYFYNSTHTTHTSLVMSQN